MPTKGAGLGAMARAGTRNFVRNGKLNAPHCKPGALRVQCLAQRIRCLGPRRLAELFLKLAAAPHILATVALRAWGAP